MLTKISTTHPEVADAIANYKEVWPEINLTSKQTVLKEGDVSTILYFIVKGSMRLSNNNNGNEITIQFFFENDFVSSFESFLKGTPSTFSLNTIEDSTVLVISKEHWKIMMDQIPGFKDYFFDFTSRRFINYIDHFLSYIKENPEERYRNLLKNKSHILRRVPLQYIASYLGITTVSLSRIRSRKSI